LAESWEINEDASEYTFFLHDNAQFCDGTPITAEDVKFSMFLLYSSCSTSFSLALRIGSGYKDSEFSTLKCAVGLGESCLMEQI
jgi:ABC-type transport system substrate-binding protein